jgi:hypothetical protein
MSRTSLARRNPSASSVLALVLLAGAGLGGIAYALARWIGIAGPAAELGGPTPIPPVGPVPTSPTVLPATGMIALASTFIGVHEVTPPKNSNRGGWVDVFNHGTGQAWCAWFVSYVLRRSGLATKDYPSVADIHARAASLNALSTLPTVGAVFLHVTGTGVTGYGYDHTGFVARVNVDGTWQSVEGNASDSVETEHHPNAGMGESHASFVFVPYYLLSKVFA